MKTIQLKKELAEIEYKLQIELKKLKKGMETKDFSLVTESAKAMYELNPHVGYPRLPKRARIDFMKSVLSSFQLRGIEVILPLESSLGEAIYFDILGERVATLYGENDDLLFHEFEGENISNVEAFLNKKIEKHNEVMIAERLRIEKNTKKIEELKLLMDSPSILFRDDFRSYRSVGQSICLLGNTPLARFIASKESVWTTTFYEYVGWLLLIPQIKKASCQKRLKNKIELLKEEIVRCEKCAEYSEEKYLLLDARKSEFKQRLLDLIKLSETYRIPIRETKL